MSNQQDEPSAAEVLAELTGKPVEEFEYDKDEYPQKPPEDAKTEVL